MASDGVHAAGGVTTPTPVPVGLAWASVLIVFFWPGMRITSPPSFWPLSFSCQRPAVLGVLTSNVSNLTKLSESLACTLLVRGLVSRLTKLTKRRVARARARAGAAACTAQ